MKEYEEKIAGIPQESIAYVDESGIDTCLSREYGYAPKGQEFINEVRGRKFKRTGIVAAQIGKKIVAPFEYSGTMNGNLFESWFEQQLLPALKPGTTIVMDNASFHRKKHLFSIAHAHGFHLIFLPPYSPELNPIEHFWSWLKRSLRKILPDSPSFDDALYSIFQVA